MTANLVMNRVAAELVRVVYVEDDTRLGALTAQYLRVEGLEVSLVTRGDEAVAAICRAKPDVVLLDLTLPGTDGFEVCTALRRLLDVPIIMVTARSEEVDRVRGLDAGADDYVPKPFFPAELLARIRAHARRAKGKIGPSRERVAVGDLVVDAATMTASLKG